MKKIKEYLLSENGRRLVNIVFLFAFVVPNPFISLFAGLLWLLFLYYSMKRIDSFAVKAVYSVFGILALFMIVLSIISIF